jgi:hypothetical protein
MTQSKVFGIGLHKTGTSTLRECFRILGYNVCPEELAYLTRFTAAARDYRDCIAMAKRYDAFEDSPWNYAGVYQVLDVVFPDARFVLTMRDRESWFRSLLRWVSLYNSAPDMNLAHTIGVAPTANNKDTAILAYLNYNTAVQEYFANRPGKLLMVDWEAGDTWDRLCGFLDHPVPSQPFPHMLRYDPATVDYRNSAIP